MSDEPVTVERLHEVAEGRRERREFFRTLAEVAGFAGGLTMAMSSTGALAQVATAPTDADILNFALNLEYLESTFYSFAVNGTNLPNDLVTGQGTPGAVTGGRAVTFTDPVVQQYAREIAADEIAHVRFLRQQLGNSAIARPALNISGDPGGAFAQAAAAAGLVPAGAGFDPYANDQNFLLGAFIFEDVGVTAYKGAAPLITSKTYLEAAAGILAVEAYHASILRTALYTKGLDTPSARTSADAISDARDRLDGPQDLDQGISPIGTQSNIVPADAFGIAFSRSAAQVLNVAFLKSTAVDRGGFFPDGVNGAIKMSAAN